MQVSTTANNHAYPVANPRGAAPTNPRGTAAAAPAATAARKPVIDRNSELYKASQDFEALFIKQMLDVMRKTIHKEDDLLGGGLGQDVYEDMLYNEYAKKMASTAQFGLADIIYKQVSSK